MSLSESGEVTSEPLPPPVLSGFSTGVEERLGFFGKGQDKTLLLLECPEELMGGTMDPILEEVLEGESAGLNLMMVALSPRFPLSSDPRRTHVAAGSDETAVKTPQHWYYI